MKTNRLRKNFSIICALMFGSSSFAQAATTTSTYVGPAGGNWSDPANWSPAIVPNNTATQKFDVSVGAQDEGVQLNIDATINSLSLTGEFPRIASRDHSLFSAATSVGEDGPYGGNLYFDADTVNVRADLGELAEFSDNTLNRGVYEADTGVTDFSFANLTATIQFNGADIRTNNAVIGLYGPRTQIVDEAGHNALAKFQHNLLNGIFDSEQGHSFTSAGSIINEGYIALFTSYNGIEGPETFTVNGDYTGIGYTLDPGTLGITQLVAAGPLYDATMLIKGQLTNYDAATKTLNKTRYVWEAANGRSATTRVLGGATPMDVVTSKASLALVGPHTGFRDKNGADALRNLAVSARLVMGDRNFTTVSDFTSTSRLSIFGDTHFNVNGHLSIRSGFFEISALDGYARDDFPDFPVDPPYRKSYVTVKGSLNMRSTDSFRYGIFDNATSPSVTIGGAAILGGDLLLYLIDGGNVTSSDSFTVLTAHKIVGHFSNVANGQRIDLLSGEGSMLVTITKTAVVLSDFQPAP
jgi:hypothetical protein